VELGKFGPGSKAQGRAKSPKVSESSGSIFVQGFHQTLTPHRTARIAPKLQKNPLNRNNPGQGACTNKQNNQDGTLTREQRRNLPSPDDVTISEQNVIIRDGQATYKIKDHGHDFGIKSTRNLKGRLKTERTRENIEAETIQNIYNQIPSISVEGTDWETTAWSVAKHAHHGPNFASRTSK